MDLLIIMIVTFFLVIIIPGGIIIHLKHDWMTIHFYCPSEILFFDTVVERSRVYSKAYRAYVRRPVIIILMFGYIATAIFAAKWLMGPTVVWFKALPGNPEINRFLCFMFLMIPIFCGFPLFCWHGRRWMRKYLRTYLNEHGIPICMNCGYDLRGQVSPSCPECGTEFEKKSID